MITWDTQDAYNHQAKFAESTTKANRVENHNETPYGRWKGVQLLLRAYLLYRMGEKEIIPDVIYLCALHSIPLPRWLQEAYASIYEKVKFEGTRSWDDVLGVPHPKGVHLKNKKHKLNYSAFVYALIFAINENKLWGECEVEKNEDGEPYYDRNGRMKYYNPSAIGDSLFEEIGKYLGISKSLAEKYYYDNKQRLEKRLKRLSDDFDIVYGEDKSP